jgi:hypothetical protein
MGTGAGGWGVGGVGSERATDEREILWGGSLAQMGLVAKSAQISGATRDAGNTPTTVLRPGLIMGRVTTGLEYEEWDADATDGTQDFAGILDFNELRAQDWDATNQDRNYRLLVARGLVRARQLLIEGAAFVGHAHEYLARRQMIASGFIFDDDPQGYKGGAPRAPSYETATTDTLTADQNGMTLYYSNAASVTVTLPAIKPGLEYTLIRAADEEFIVVSPTADNVIVGNDLSADGVTFTTAGEQIGATVFVKSEYVNGTLKWRMILPPPPFGTGTATLTYAVNT